jgi:hypothetical protein
LPPAAAQNGNPTFRAPGQREFRSKNYQVVTDLPLERAQEIARHMDAVFDEYARRLSAFPARNSAAVKLFLWNDEDTYLKFLRSRGALGTGSAGMFFFDGTDAGLTTWTRGQERRRLWHILQHEGFHQFAFVRIGTSLPMWANEGLAEYFGQAILLRDRLEIGLAPEGRLAAAQAAITKGETYSFSEMLSMSNESWNRRVSSRDPRAGLMYTQAWSMVHFLVHAEGGKYAERFEEYLQLVGAGRESAGAFAEAFGSADAAPFERAWREFTLALRPDPVSTAAERLEFIGAGLEALRGKGVSVSSAEELRDKLREWGFVLRRTEHGLERAIDASDDKLFLAPEDASAGKAKRAAAPALTLTAPERPGAPMGALVTGLRVKVRLVWRQAEPGRWLSDIVYE